MINSIINYMDFLGKHFGLHVSIHCTDGRLDPYMSALAPYNIHSNPYCLFVKSSKENWDRCRLNQQKALGAARSGMFCGSCYAGVGEYVIPIKHGDKFMGFISVGAYAGSEEKRDHFAEKYGFTLEEIRERYRSFLSPEPPDADTVKTLIDPLVSMLVLLFERDNDVAVPSGDGYDYGHIVSYLHNNLSEKITLADVADFCHYSPSFVARLFKARSGMTINEYLGELRMKKACELLTLTDIPISEIAEACGFFDTNYFISFFSKRFGLPPKKFRMQKR